MRRDLRDSDSKTHVTIISPGAQQEARLSIVNAALTVIELLLNRDYALVILTTQKSSCATSSYTYGKRKTGKELCKNDR